MCFLEIYGGALVLVEGQAQVPPALRTALCLTLPTGAAAVSRRKSGWDECVSFLKEINQGHGQEQLLPPLNSVE